MRGRTLRFVWVLAGGLALLIAGSASAASLQISSVSNPHPSLVSGDDVLVRVTAPGSLIAKVHVSLNGHDVTTEFASESNTARLGLVSSLRAGKNTIEATVSRGHRKLRARLRVVNHPITGPVFSGPQQKPFYCQTEGFGLDPAQQPYCSAPTKVTYRYRTTAGAFADLADPTASPADLATTTVNGTSVPYIIRIERGVIDRAVYEIAALYDGHPPGEANPGWNGRLVYTFGGGCNAGFHQGTGTGGVINDQFLSRGYAVASATLNVLDNNCSPIISAEVAMMVKEHFIETYGPVTHTIGWGASGGGIQQYDIAESYPGILDGIIPGISFPDPLSTGGPVVDCRLLLGFLAGPGADFTAAQRAALTGYLDFTTCTSWDRTFASRATATDSCDPSIPLAARWNAATNPKGVKCESTEQLVNQVGRDPKTGFVRVPLNNVGVQYGLGALTNGTITPTQFATLNASIGGLDLVGKPSPTRIPGDLKAIEASYRDDIVNSASLGLPQTPIIDQRYDLDFAGQINDIHTTEWSFVMRKRLLDTTKTADNQVILESQPTEIVAANIYALDAMDRWLTAIGNDHSHRDRRAKIAHDRPSDLGDGCYLSATERIKAKLTYPATGPCAARFPVGANSRLLAGESLEMNTLKCQLKPLDFSGYKVTFSAEDQAKLRSAFPSGVCDYTKPGVKFQKPIGVWLTYGDEKSGLTKPTPLPRGR